MPRIPDLVVALILLCSSVLAQLSLPASSSSMSSSFASVAAVEGVTIPFLATSEVTLDGLEINLAPGVWDLEVWWQQNTGALTYPGPVAQLGQASGVVSAGLDVPTPVPIELGAMLIPTAQPVSGSMLNRRGVVMATYPAAFQPQPLTLPSHLLLQK